MNIAIAKICNHECYYIYSDKEENDEELQIQICKTIQQVNPEMNRWRFYYMCITKKNYGMFEKCGFAPFIQHHGDFGIGVYLYDNIQSAKKKTPHCDLMIGIPIFSKKLKSIFGGIYFFDLFDEWKRQIYSKDNIFETTTSYVIGPLIHHTTESMLECEKNDKGHNVLQLCIKHPFAMSAFLDENAFIVKI